MQDVTFEIQMAIDSKQLNYMEIAEKYRVTVDDVQKLADELYDLQELSQIAENDYFDDY